MKTNFNPFPELLTSRLLLRQIGQSDINDIFALRSDPLVNRYLDREQASTREDARSYIDRITANIHQNKGIVWAVILKENEKLIGTVCFWNFAEKESRAEIGYELFPAYHGKGFMHEVMTQVIDFGFSVMELQSIEAVVHPGNKASIKILEKNNFKRDFIAEALINTKEQPAKMMIYTLSRKQ